MVLGIWNLYSQIARLTLGDEITKSQFCGGWKAEFPEETLEVGLRSTETQSTNYICSRGERRD